MRSYEARTGVCVPVPLCVCVCAGCVWKRSSHASCAQSGICRCTEKAGEALALHMSPWRWTFLVATGRNFRRSMSSWLIALCCGIFAVAKIQGCTLCQCVCVFFSISLISMASYYTVFLGGFFATLGRALADCVISLFWTKLIPTWSLVKKMPAWIIG